MAHWIKVPNRPKAQRFRCSKCRKVCSCIKYVEHKTVCDYKYCPYCGEDMQEGIT